MLTSVMLRALQQWLAPPFERETLPRYPFPEWSDLMAEQHATIWWRVKPFASLSIERIVVLCQGIAYLENHGIPGALVESGGKGGGSMAAALALLARQSTQRQICLFETPERMQDAKQAMMQTGYPWEKILFVPGQTETALSEQIALLHLNRDGYESILQELGTLYPRLAVGGVLIVNQDESEARKAVEDYFRRHEIESPLRFFDGGACWTIKKSTLQARSRVA